MDKQTDPRLALMGPQTTQGNLRAVRTRAAELQKTIDEVIFGLTHFAGGLKWDDIIRKYSVINAQLAALREALRPGTLDGFALLPRLVPDQGHAHAVEMQLSSSLTPQGAGAAAAASEAVDGALGLTPDMASMQRFEILTSTLEAHNNLISALTSGGMKEGPLFAQGALRRQQKELSDATAAALQDKARSAANAAAALAAAARGQPAAGRQGAAPPGARRPGAEPLDPSLLFLITGKAA